MKASRRAMNMNYAIRQVTIPADEMENKGAEVIRMNIGDPNKWDFETPEYFKAALREAVDMVDNGYGDSQGSIELREAIVDREFEKHGARISADDVIVTNGVSEAIMVIMGALLEPGDEILVPGPGYSSYTQYIKYFDAVPVPYEQVEENDWQPDIDMMRSRITERTRAIVVINPNNPTGAVYPEKAVREIGDLAAEFNLPVISDEIYDKITFNTRFFSFSRTPSDVMKIILNGFSKVNLMPGWRVGYGYFMDEKGELEEIFEGVMRQLRARLCPNVPCQWAARAALQGPQDYISTLNAKLSSRADYTYKRLNEIPGISVKKAKGSMFMFPKVEANLWKDDMDFILDLLWNTGVLFVPGSGFCEEFGKNHFRTIILPDIPILEKAYDRVETFMIGKLKSR
ncbi:MAG: alanine-synthesizing transaminase [Candidatus Methanomethylophilaceae archaeon]|nr:alanine-synthesizing transaminase [Candidatus Methanomethylophilaceae archaeon]MDI3542032.1 alanine-synthesizing transaminase [Candidatus Methanomethylophilaceae archaeon]